LEQSPPWRDRCASCLYNGTADEHELYGDDMCLRDYPRTTKVDRCKIKPHKQAKWRDAYTKQTSMLSEIEIDDKELFELMQKPVKDKAERMKTLQGITKRHEKIVEKKGQTARLGFGKDFDEHDLSVYRAGIGVPSVDEFLGGGFPTAPFTIYGGESAGKTTTVLYLAGALQRAGYVVAIADAEHTLDREWAASRGVNVDELLINQDHVMEDQLNWILKLAESGAVDFIFYDSLSAGLPRGKIAKKSGTERDLDNADVALRARVMSDFFPRILHHLKINHIGFGLIAQTRTTGLGSAWVHEDVSGGNARKFFDTLTLEVRRGPKANAPVGDDGKTPLGYEFVMICRKSKISGIREHDEVRTIFWNDKGFDPEYEYVIRGIAQGLIVKTSAAGHLYTDSKGIEHKLKAGKEYKVKAIMAEQGLLNDLRMQITGEADEPEETID
jgi:RecA/RadA recombinase